VQNIVKFLLIYYNYFIVGDSMMKRLFFVVMLVICSFIPFNVLAETYDGEYSVEYLLKNYNAVTLGHKTYNLPSQVFHKQNILDFNEKGVIKDIYSIDGPVLVNGNYTSFENSYFGNYSSNIKSYISGTKGSNISTSSQLVTDSNYIDFDKLYLQVMNTSQALADNTEYHISDARLEVSKPGIYTINNTAGYYSEKENGSEYYTSSTNSLLIKNYDRNSLYIFNYYNEYINLLPNVKIMENGSANSISLRDYIESGQYTGNIIFNFPYAKFIDIQVFKYRESNKWGLSGNIIAPNAIVFLWCNYRNSQGSPQISYYYGTIISNSIVGDYYYDNYVHERYYIKKANYRLNKKIIDNADKKYVEEINDYNDDWYSRDYSISDLLQNYSLITLNHKAIDSKSKILQYGNTPGSIKMFHIAGPVLISGDLYGKVYENEVDSYFNSGYNSHQKFDRTIFDLESNRVTESFIKGKFYTRVKRLQDNSLNDASLMTIYPWDNMPNENYQYSITKNNIFFTRPVDTVGGYYPINMYENNGYPVENYINFDRLYSNIVAEQKGIDEGTKVKSAEGVAHIKIGGNYVIDNINDINKIVFDNFDDNKKMITVITIKNSGDINFPEINRDSGSYKGIVTNDYFGKERATHLYEQNTFISEDSYYGNIVFNVPNATYIKLKENAPFAGHLIAPNADVETPETHFAGCFIVNSIYGEGNTEAHFYPLTAFDNCDCDDSKVPDNLKTNFNEMRLKKLLGGEKTTIETTAFGDQAQYNKDVEQLNNIINSCPRKTGSSIVQILTNPKTYSTIGIVFGIVLIAFVGLKISKKRKTIN